jgi:hypothetical protein
MGLPDSKDLPVQLLAASLNKTSATYKFYWLLSILQSTEMGHQKIYKKELFSRMISNAWYTVNYFNISFGKQDLIQDTIREILKLETITVDERRSVVFEKLMNNANSGTTILLSHFNKNVPHWFLSPWFPKIGNESDSMREKRIYTASKSFELNCLYALHLDHIEINPKWIEYLKSNSSLLKDFCYWNLALFLQSKNPNVPDIPNKLIKPATRNNLTKQRHNFWDIVFDEMGSIKCIYTGQALSKDNYAIEHFIPYSFVSHDLIWNLIPADKSFNITKSNKLPIFEKYFQPFFSLQQSAYEIVMKKNPKNLLLEDYHTVFHTQEQTLNQSRFQEIIQPLISIAANNGFEYMN